MTGKKKYGSALNRGRKAKTATSCSNAFLTHILWASDKPKASHQGRVPFPFLGGLTYVLEELGAGAGHFENAEASRTKENS
ncbi:hypothetical protein JOC86_003214 [Bacillus pakistanensis]|uniref:Uncharacterized protein n=1 Tax=Rossellomorea pakistanensis TaxID=992288 RepID=A0ABS2NFQ2_9BACI|nr:hypothetical protein [Bacillus pakistanensis]